LAKQQNSGQAVIMGKLFKLLIFLAIIGFIGLVGYAYVGPFFGVDFSPEQTETRQPVTLTAD
jgi:hypothetical protein